MGVRRFLREHGLATGEEFGEISSVAFDDQDQAEGFRAIKFAAGLRGESAEFRPGQVGLLRGESLAQVVHLVAGKGEQLN